MNPTGQPFTCARFLWYSCSTIILIGTTLVSLSATARLSILAGPSLLVPTAKKLHPQNFTTYDHRLFYSYWHRQPPDICPACPSALDCGTLPSLALGLSPALLHKSTSPVRNSRPQPFSTNTNTMVDFQQIVTHPSLRVLASELQKPDLDDRSYRVIQLGNKLEALIVTDNETDKASASLAVHVGSFSDSQDLPVSTMFYCSSIISDTVLGSSTCCGAFALYGNRKISERKRVQPVSSSTCRKFKRLYSKDRDKLLF